MSSGNFITIDQAKKMFAPITSLNILSVLVFIGFTLSGIIFAIYLFADYYPTTNNTRTCIENIVGVPINDYLLNVNNGNEYQSSCG